MKTNIATTTSGNTSVASQPNKWCGQNFLGFILTGLSAQLHAGKWDDTIDEMADEPS